MLTCASKSLALGAIGVLAVLVASAPAHAVPVNVTFSMNYNFFAPAVATNVLYGPGTLTVQFANGTSGGHVGAGALHVVSGTAMLNNTFNAIVLGNPITFTGMQFDTFPGSGTGAITAGGMFSLMTVGHVASGMLHCTGALCGLAGFPASQQIPLTSQARPISFAGVMLGFPSVGPASFANAIGQGSMTPQGGFQQITASGQEVGRQVVPEPGTGLLLGVGLAAFGIATNVWRRRA
jgi:hypothetical protein